jgi:hypothetical protein
MDLVSARRFTRKLPNLVSDRDSFPFQGGLNLVDTPLQVRPGQLMACKNYEVAMRGGYERIEGFERLDGRPKPSEALYWILYFVGGNSNYYPALGATVNGATSGASGVTISTADSTQPEGYLALRSVSGTFIDGENVRVGGTAFGVIHGTPTANDASTDEEHAEYLHTVQEYARAQIEAVPGEGPVLGVAVYNGVAYAIRNNLGSSAAIMHKATASGWEPVAMGRRLAFDAGNTAPAINETITGASGATGVVRRIVITKGDWDTHDAEGYFILSGVTGAFVDNDTLTSPSGAAVAVGTDTAQSLPAGGRYDFRVHNFYGEDARKRLYGVNQVGKAFEFQNTPEFLCFLETGTSDDRPTHLAIHKNQLWLSFRGGSIQKSGTGEPSDWTAITGAFELAVGDNVTGLLEEVGGALFAFSRNSTRVITGNEADGYSNDNFGVETGAYEGSIQRFGQGFFIDDRGFTTLAAAQDFGNFSSNNVSALIEPLIRELKNMIVTSVSARSKNRLRYFFSNGRVISVGFIGKKIGGFTTCDYGISVKCAFSGEDADGNELLLMGSETGYVYQADSGTSFDGEPIQAFARLVFHHSGVPSRIKRYRLAHVDLSTRGPTSLRATVDYSNADPTSSFEPVKDVTMTGGGGFWDVSNWNEFRWSAGIQAQATFKLEGSGYNIGLLFSSEAADELPHTLNGVTFHESMRRLNRST